MSLDMSLHARAARTGRGYLRFYRWSPSCLSFGRHEPALKRYDRDRITTLALDTVRRPTGGRAVWHADEVTYSVAAPESAMGSLTQAYERIHLTIASALRALGAPVELAPARRGVPVDAGACFAAPAGGEVVIDSGKVVGSAQLRHGGVVLQHGSVLLDDDQSLVSDITLGPAAAPEAQPLSRILGRRVGWEEVATAISQWAREWGDGWEELTDVEQLLAQSEQMAAQFRDSAWTWQR